MVMKDYIQADKVPEGPKTVAEDRWNDRLAPCEGTEVFQNPKTLERWEGDTPSRKTFWLPALKKQVWANAIPFS
jgi:hypothetical protein